MAQYYYMDCCEVEKFQDFFGSLLHHSTTMLKLTFKRKRKKNADKKR